jgi:hypothetical protein
MNNSKDQRCKRACHQAPPFPTTRDILLEGATWTFWCQDYASTRVHWVQRIHATLFAAKVARGRSSVPAASAIDSSLKEGGASICGLQVSCILSIQTAPIHRERDNEVNSRVDAPR